MARPVLPSAFLAVCCGCATLVEPTVLKARSKDPAHPIFVGHSTDGEVIMATSHADAMHGLAVAASELGAPQATNGDDLLICQQEMLTGTHVPTWICRYPNEVEKQRIATRNWLDQPKSCTNCMGR